MERIPGIAQAKELNRGIKDLPWSPRGRSALSIIRAALLKYPLSSKSPKKKNKIPICGIKTITLPTPVITPSVRRLESSPFGRTSFRYFASESV